jgi:ribosome maturation factor RimP
MDRHEIIEQLRSLISDYLKDMNLDLVDFNFRYEGRDLVLRILVDKPDGGISIVECARLNINLSRILDEENIIQDRYILEVSSPGLDRPLKTKSDFLRRIDKEAHFFFKEPITGKFELDGIIKKVEGDSVFIQIETQILEVPLSKITKAKQLI